MRRPETGVAASSGARAGSGVLASALAWWWSAPGGFSSEQRRAYSAGVIAVWVGLILHVLLVGLFAWWQVGVLVVVNVVSVAVWVLIIVAFRRGWFGVVTALAAAEVLAHAWFVVVYVGWGFGAQYYLLFLLLTVPFLPYRTPVLVGLAAGVTASFVAMYYTSEATAPLATVPAGQLAAVNIANIVAVFGVCGLIVAFPVRVAERAEQAAAREHERSERLLLNVLPAPIAARLKDRPEVIADGFDSASVLFADLVGFTPLAEQLSPREVVSVLDDVFTRLDALVDDYGLEKIKTIGDAYMVAAGIPLARPDHAPVLARFGLAAHTVLDQVNRERGTRLQLRIGISSGPVVAGVIGRRRLLYDLWGDTVNTASRMESHGLPGRVQITEATRRLLDDQPVEARGLLDVKGKGPIPTFLLLDTPPATP